jgi:hypothetical protein
VSDRSRSRSDVDLARELVEAVVRAGLTISETLAALLEQLSEDSFPGENNPEVLLGMVAGSCAPIARAAGEVRCAEAIDLVEKVHRKFVDDLRAAAALAGQRER